MSAICEARINEDPVPIEPPNDRTYPRWLGPTRLEHPFTLAALSGYSDMGMRVTCRSLGACLTRNEVVLDQFILDCGRGPRSGRHLADDDHPVCAQLMGNDPVAMGEAAARLASFGYDVIDINFGCPVKKVLGRCRGGFLLGDPETAIEMVRRVRDAVELPVTVKMRRGKDNSRESTDRFWRILDASVAAGIVGVAVHGRTVEQRYEGRATWDRIAQVKRRYPGQVVFGSGDLFAAEDCLAMLDETGCDGVTIARGAISNPWIFRDCLALWRGEPLPPTPTLREQGELMDWQYQLAILQYGPERAGRQMRKFGIKRAPLHPLGDALRQAFVRITTPADWERVRREFYASDDVVERATLAVAADWSNDSC